MVDAVTTEYVYDGERRKTIHLTNISDGTGESAVIKVNVSDITFNLGETPTYTAVDSIESDIQGFTNVQLYFDATTDDEIAIMTPGYAVRSYMDEGGKLDPQSSGTTGDIVLTTAGAVSGATYDILIKFRPKS